MTLVVDASVATKWLVAEPDSDVAEAICGVGQPLMAPELIVVEVSSALQKKVQRNQISVEHATSALDGLSGFFDDLFQMRALAARALTMASQIAHPVYDCYYVVLAEQIGATVVTADEKLLARLADTEWASSAIHMRDAVSKPRRAR